MRWHVERMRSRGSNITIVVRRFKAAIRQWRKVVGVNQVMKCARMVWLRGKDFLQNCTGL